MNGRYGSANPCLVAYEKKGLVFLFLSSLCLGIFPPSLLSPAGRASFHIPPVLGKSSFLRVCTVISLIFPFSLRHE